MKNAAANKQQDEVSQKCSEICTIDWQEKQQRENIGRVALDLESGTPSEAYREGLDWDD